MFRDQIILALAKATGVENPHLEFTEDLQFGDYASNVAMQQAKEEGISPRVLAENYAKKLSEDSSLKQFVSKVEIAGPGFINFYLSEKALEDALSEATKSQENFGKSQLNKGRKVVVEYSSPNIAKPFTIGHLRPTIIGDAVANILEFAGWTVYRDNHLGDWGTQFGKQIYAIKTWGNEEAISKSKNPVRELVDLYIKFHEESEKDPSLEDKAREWFKKLEDGDLEARRLWQMCIEWSLVEFEKIYKQLAVAFTENDGKGYGESYFEDKMKAVIDELTSKKLLVEGKEGAKLVFFPEDKYPPMMILKKDGSTLYATRDLATDKFRLQKYGQDVVIVNEVGIEQSLYFQQLFELEKILGWVEEGQRIHIKHGHIRFADKKMSTRKGNVIWLDEVLQEAISRAKSFGSDDKLAKTISIGALKWNDLKRDPKMDIVFDWDELLNMQGNSGPYIQYTYARIQSVLEKKDVKPEAEHENFGEEEKKIMRFLSRFPGIILDASNLYSPNIIAKYLFELSQKYNAFYNSNRIIGSEAENARLLMSSAVGITIKNGLKLLGIESPSKM